MHAYQSHEDLITEINHSKEFLIIQDLDGVCMQLVKDPLTRTMPEEYIKAASKLIGKFFVLTNGEHGGYRGVNKIIETTNGGKQKTIDNGLYLPGLAAGGVQYQDRYGNISHPGVDAKQINFLKTVPSIMNRKLTEILKIILPTYNSDEIDVIVKKSVLDMELSPTINLNILFDILIDDLHQRKKLQRLLLDAMNEIIILAEEECNSDKFFLHIAPNIISNNGQEQIKYSTEDDIGTTDVQFMIKGALKEAGLLVLLNKYIESTFGLAPFGNEFNVLEAPTERSKLLNLCVEKIKPELMPMIIGVGDTVTSVRSEDGRNWMRGGSDRGFLTLIKDIERLYKKNNKVLLVDSSGGEVSRPSLKDEEMKGITDPYDELKFDSIFTGGPKQYIDWFINLSN